jgi:dihydroflavonol-4-reductase
LTVGLNEVPQPLDEDADWGRHAFRLPYGLSRREAEQAALARSPGDLPEIVVVNPSFTLGPDDPVGAPANGLVKRMAKTGLSLGRTELGWQPRELRDSLRDTLDWMGRDARV